MKNFSFYLILGLCFILNVALSCSSSEEPGPSAPPLDVDTIKNAAMQGTWRVTKYSDHGGNETDHFEGYTFTFGSGDVLTATNGTDTYTGSWTVTGNGSVQDESPEDPVDFNIYFEGPLNFSDINDDWDFISRSDTKMEFIDETAEAGKKDDKITFERN